MPRRGPRRTGVGKIRYININFPESDRELYEWADAMAKKRRQGKSNFVRNVLEEAKAKEEASDVAKALQG